MKWRRYFLLLLFGLGVGLWVAREPVLHSAGEFLIVEDPPRKADAIVVLAGSVPDRILEAVTLYKDGYAPRIVVSREPPPRAYARLAELGVSVPTPHEINLSIARQLGIPGEALLETGGKPGSTLSEAADLIRFLWSHGFHRVLLVTSKGHTRRARQIYGHLAGDRLELVMRPSRYDPYDPARWWKDRTTTRRVLIEFQKMAVFQLFDRWRHAPLQGDE